MLPVYNEKPKYGYIQDRRLIKNVVMYSCCFFTFFTIILWFTFPGRMLVENLQPGGKYRRRKKKQFIVPPSSQEHEKFSASKYKQERIGNFNRMTYQFSEVFNITNKDTTYIFEHPKRGDIMEMEQNVLIDYQLCCSMFYQVNSRGEAKLLLKSCGGEEDQILQCIIKNDYVMAKVDLSGISSKLAIGEYMQIVADCVLKWSSGE